MHDIHRALKVKTEYGTFSHPACVMAGVPPLLPSSRKNRPVFGNHMRCFLVPVLGTPARKQQEKDARRDSKLGSSVRIVGKFVVCEDKKEEVE